ncbi:hypothetical protein LENED_006084 [Lentinula edodes]|uniref:Uncharacterized protein n=1 Tax=Lentinula edodes TaxID=5353 RepID=A0A1Q3EAQ0_LENED|nr:hypothetical protein LENED_006084 [Lentinula edodes]
MSFSVQVEQVSVSYSALLNNSKLAEAEPKRGQSYLLDDRSVNLGQACLRNQDAMIAEENLSQYLLCTLVRASVHSGEELITNLSLNAPCDKDAPPSYAFPLPITCVIIPEPLMTFLNFFIERLATETTRKVEDKLRKLATEDANGRGKGKGKRLASDAAFVFFVLNELIRFFNNEIPKAADGEPHPQLNAEDMAAFQDVNARRRARQEELKLETTDLTLLLSLPASRPRSFTPFNLCTTYVPSYEPVGYVS